MLMLYFTSQGKKKKSGKKGSGKKKKAAEDVPDPTEGMTIEELRDKVRCSLICSGSRQALQC